MFGGCVTMAYEGNLFGFTNVPEWRSNIRRWAVRGVSAGADRPVEIQRLKLAVSRETRAPVAHIDDASGLWLALPADKAVEHEILIGRQLARLEPAGDALEVRLRDGTVGRRFWLATVRFACRTPFINSPAWGSEHSSVHIEREPVRVVGHVAIHRAFRLRIVEFGDVDVALCVDVVHRYIDTRPLPIVYPRLVGAVGRTAMYTLGPHWYRVRILEPSTDTVAENRIECPEHGRESLLNHLQRKWPRDPQIAALRPDSPVVVYEHGQDRRSAVAEFLRRTIKQDELALRAAHQATILAPDVRRRVLVEFVEQNLCRLSFGGCSLAIASSPVEVVARRVALPALRYGRSRTLAFPGGNGAGAAAVCDYARQRLRMLDARVAGPAADAPLETQHLLVPDTLPRHAAERFREAVEFEIRHMLPASGELRLIRYDAPRTQRLPDQVSLITAQIQRTAPDGYGVLVLPRNGHRKLHDYLHNDLRHLFQFQGATEPKVAEWFGDPGRSEGDRHSFARHVALGVLIANHRAPFVLAEVPHHPIVLGVDVRRGVVGITLVANAGEQFRFHSFHHAGMRERLSRRRFAEELGTFLRREVERLALRPTRLLIVRDGRLLAGEADAVRDALASLGAVDCWAPTFVEVHKSSMTSFRLWRRGDGRVENPEVGVWIEISDRRAVLCTTGVPFRLPGTAQPLLVVHREGPASIREVVEDVLRWSFLAWNSPTAAARLPLPLKLTDTFLETVSPEAETDEDFQPDSQPTRETVLR
jgi:hypothetical protein